MKPGNDEAVKDKVIVELKRACNVLHDAVVEALNDEQCNRRALMAAALVNAMPSEEYNKEVAELLKEGKP